MENDRLDRLDAANQWVGLLSLSSKEHPDISTGLLKKHPGCFRILLKRFIQHTNPI